MDYHPVFGPTPDVGLEVEVTDFQNGHSMNTIARALIDAGFMDSSFSSGRHDWHCRCSVCGPNFSNVIYPVSWVMQRDASLATDGAEYISSPFPVHEVFMDTVMDAYDIFSERALWSADRSDQRGAGTAIAGFHVHAFCPGNLDQLDGENYVRLVSEAPDTMMNFIPEFFTLAAANLSEINRPLNYRLPAGNGGHHNYLAVAGTSHNRTAVVRNPWRLEWRFWEMDYNDPDYFKAAIYISASLTQALLRPAVNQILQVQGALEPWNRNRSDIDHILSEFSTERLEILEEVIMTGSALRDDLVGQEAVQVLLERVR